MFVIKADGKREIFRPQKIISSLVRIGVDESTARSFAEDIKGVRIRELRSDDIFRRITELLYQYNPVFAGKYNLRRAIMQLGPTGYPFEKYIAALLESYGYLTKTNQTVWGACVQYEIDVIVERDDETYVVECKYHNTPGARCDLKVALYVWARFLDIKEKWERDPSNRQEFYNGWLVTNTRCTSEAIRFAECKGMKLTSWGYPQHEGLEKLIEQKALYPMNVFPFLNNGWLYARLAEHGLYLLRDIVSYTTSDLAKKIGAQQKDISLLQKYARGLCGNNK